MSTEKQGKVRCTKKVIDAQNFIVECTDGDETKQYYCSVQPTTSIAGGAVGISGSKQQHQIVCWSDAEIEKAAGKKMGKKPEEINWE